MSEEIIQKGYEDSGLKIGEYEFYNIGSTTISTLKKYKIIPNINYKEYKNKKPDALLVDRRNKSKIIIIAVIEYKSPDEFKTNKQKCDTIQQCNNYAQILKAKIGIATDNSSYIWFNPSHKDSKNQYYDETSKKNKSYSRILNEDDTDFTTPFNIDFEEIIIQSIESILSIVSKTNSKFTQINIRDPTTLAKQIWQDVWSVTGKDPEKCLYTFVELLIFKYLSDLGILTKDERGNRVDFQYIYSLEKKEAFKNYSHNVRKHLKSMFKESDDDHTTIINGTILNSDVSEHSIVFHKILKKFNDFGEIKKIDPNFKSKVFEEFMKESISTKNWGRYFTPRCVIDAMIEISEIEKLEKGSKICDPACGVGGFILEPMKVKDIDFYYTIIGNNIKSRFEFYGFDKGFERDEQLTIILAKANMLIFLSELLKNNESILDSFSTLLNNTFKLTTQSIMGTLEKIEYDKYDLILTNPPYVTSGSSNYKDRIKTDANLKKFYKINSIGVEGLFLQWIINSLKPTKKAFVIIPQGVLERFADKDLREFILNECIIDGIISLPVKTFYTTTKKTYILAITKKEQDTQKERALIKQTDPIFSYIVTQIGETLDSDRLPKKENDLPDMVSLFNQFKGSKVNFKTNNKKCKIIQISQFHPDDYWSVEKLWNDEERKELGILDEKYDVPISEFRDNVQSIQNSTVKLKLEQINNIIKNMDVYTPIHKSITDIFTPVKGKSKYTKRYIAQNKGRYHVYSSQTVQDGIIGKINTFDHVDQCITWTTDGIYAGTPFYRNCPFSMTIHCGALLIKKEYETSINMKYVFYILKNVMRSYSIGETNKRLTVKMLQNITIPIPLKPNGSYDVDKQNEITKNYEIIESLQKELSYINNEMTNVVKSQITIF